MMPIKHFCLSLGMFLAANQAAAVAVGESLPEVKIAHISKGELSSETLKGKVTVLNFWATWCASCKDELKEMEEAFKDLVPQKDFQVAFISLDKVPDNAAQWFKENLKNKDEMLKHLYKDPEFKAAGILDVDAFPMTLVIDKTGKIRHIQKGFEKGKPSTAQITKVAGDLLKP